MIEVGKPTKEACAEIFSKTLEAVGRKFPGAGKLRKDAGFAAVAESCFGLDARRIRKLVATACACNRKTALDPGSLSLADLQAAVSLAHEKKGVTK